MEEEEEEVVCRTVQEQEEEGEGVVLGMVWEGWLGWREDLQLGHGHCFGTREEGAWGWTRPTR